VIPIDPPGRSFRVSSLVNNGTDVLLIDDDHPGLRSASIVIGIGDNHGVDETSNESIVIETWSESPGLGSIPAKSVVMETRSKPPGLGLIPSEHRLSGSIVIDLDSKDGISEITSEPPGLVSLSIVLDLDNDDGAGATWSEPPGLDSTSRFQSDLWEKWTCGKSGLAFPSSPLQQKDTVYQTVQSAARVRNLRPCRLSAEDSRAGSTALTWSKKIVWS